MKFFTADHHFNHKGVISFCDRPFKSVWEMNSHMINCWNKVVPPNGVVYHLGDLVFRNKGDGDEFDDLFKRLNGTIILIRGNHDDFLLRTHKNSFAKVVDIEYLKIGGKKFMLCHYAMRVWRASCHGSYHLYGHSHNTLPAYENSLDVGVDGHNFFPWTEYEILEYFERKNETNKK